MRDLLRVHGRRLVRAGEPAGAGQTAPPQTRAIGFDQTSVGLFSSTTAAGGGLREYGRLLVMEIPSHVDRVEIQSLAVQGCPDGYFAIACFWQLRINNGPVQELLLQSRLPVAVGGQPQIAAGFRYGRYGSMAEPHGIHIDIRQEGLLELLVLTGVGIGADGFVTALSVHCRCVGLMHFKGSIS